MGQKHWIEKTMDGAGNSFVIIAFPQPNTEKSYFNEQTPHYSQRSIELCEQYSVDGAVFLKNFQDQAPHYKWEFYNADGSSAEMCGNAARCVVALTFEHQLAPQTQSFQTIAGLIEGKYIQKGETAVKLSPIDKMTQRIFRFNDEIHYSFINSGVPHAVVKCNDLSLHSLKDLAVCMRNSEDFSPHGANISFYKIIDENFISAVSFERGVEDFTLACGTGAVAAAHAYKTAHQKTSSLIQVQMPGGQLKVDFCEKQPQLIGPVKYLDL